MAEQAPMDMETIKKVHAQRQSPKKKRAARADAGEAKVPVYREPPKGQTKGPIVRGPAQWIVCTTCTRLFSTEEKPVRYGIRPRHAKRHLADHRMGRIKRPTEK